MAGSTSKCHSKAWGGVSYQKRSPTSTRLPIRYPVCPRPDPVIPYTLCVIANRSPSLLEHRCNHRAVNDNGRWGHGGRQGLGHKDRGGGQIVKGIATEGGQEGQKEEGADALDTQARQSTYDELFISGSGARLGLSRSRGGSANRSIFSGWCRLVEDRMEKTMMSSHGVANLEPHPDFQSGAHSLGRIAEP